MQLSARYNAVLELTEEIFKDKKAGEWLGYNRLFESNLRKTTI